MFKSPASVSYPYPLIKIRSLRCKNGVQKGILRTLPWFSLLGLHWFVQRLQRRRAAEEGAERTSQPFLFPFYFGLSTHPTHLYYAIVLSIKSTFPRAQLLVRLYLLIAPCLWSIFLIFLFVNLELQMGILLLLLSIRNIWIKILLYFNPRIQI